MKVTSAWRRALLRASPAHELTCARQLSPADRAALPGIDDDDWLLRSSAGTEPRWKRVDASVVAALRRFAAPTRHAEAGDAPSTESVILRLVLDEVLEIEVGDRWLSGPAAFTTIFADPPRPDLDRRDGDLSRAALAYAEHLRLESPSHVARRLYAYNTCPVTPGLRSRFPDADAVGEFLDVRGKGPLASGNGGRGSIRERVGRSWLSWYQGSEDDEKPLFKLYVSPLLADLPKAFAEVAARFPASSAYAFKVGASLSGILRPDKLVVYFPSHDDLSAFAGSLEEACSGLTPHGVPFTAPASEDGLLSWGMDPPLAARNRLRWSGASWRVWLCNTLAAALFAAQNQEGSEIAPAAYAIARARLEGVDTDRWAPEAA